MLTERELIDDLTAYCDRKFTGDRRKCFAFYAVNGKLGISGLVDLFADAGIGNAWIRMPLARAVLARMDKNDDGTISVEELMEEVEKRK